MPLTANGRLAAFSILFPEPQARVLAKLSWPEVHAGSAGPKGHGPFARWTQLERERLYAFCALVVDFGTPPAPATPIPPRCTHPIALSFHPRVASVFDCCCTIRLGHRVCMATVTSPGNSRTGSRIPASLSFKSLIMLRMSRVASLDFCSPLIEAKTE